MIIKRIFSGMTLVTWNKWSYLVRVHCLGKKSNEDKTIVNELSGCWGVVVNDARATRAVALFLSGCRVMPSAIPYETEKY